MKMREELDLYKRKTAALEDQVVLLKADHEHIVQTLETSHFNEVGSLEAAHKKVVEQKDSTIKYRSDEADLANRQLNNLHDILDVIPGVLPRKKDGDYNGEHACHVRLASVLAQKFM